MTVTLKDKNQLVIPPSVQRRAGLKAGDRLEFKVSGRVITITPKLGSAGDDYTPAQRRSIDRGIAQSEKEYRQGRSFGPFDTHEEFIASLHGEGKKSQAKKLKRPAR